MNIKSFAVQHGVTVSTVYYALKREGIPIESIMNNSHELTDEGVEILNCIYSGNADEKIKLKKMSMRMRMRELRAEEEEEMMRLLKQKICLFKTSDNEIMEFVKHLPYETHLHYIYEADKVLRAWRDEIPEQIPEGLDARRFFKAHVLNEAGYDNVKPSDSWMEYEPYYGNKVYFEIGDTTFCLRVEPDGIYAKHESNDQGRVWTEWERVTH